VPESESGGKANIAKETRNCDFDRNKKCWPLLLLFIISTAIVGSQSLYLLLTASSRLYMQYDTSEVLESSAIPSLLSSHDGPRDLLLYICLILYSSQLSQITQNVCCLEGPTESRCGSVIGQNDEDCQGAGSKAEVEQPHPEGKLDLSIV